VLEAATSAVKAGLLWVTNGPMSFCGEEPAAGAIAKTAVLRSPPAPIALISGAHLDRYPPIVTEILLRYLPDRMRERLNLSAGMPGKPQSEGSPPLFYLFYQVEIRRRPARGWASITIQQYHKLLLPQETNLVNGVYSDP
jgi:hypothetical protein